MTSWDTAQSYTLQDQFTTALSAGSVNGTSAEPTGGTRTVTDTNSKISITGGVLNFATGEAANNGIWYSSLSRAAGKVMLAKVVPSDTNGAINVGWDTNTSGAINDTLVFAASGVLQIVPNGGTAITVGSYTATTYYVAGAMRSTGFYWFIKGGAFTSWTLLWITAVGTAAGTPSLTAGSTTSVFTADDIAVPATTYSTIPLVSDGFSASTTDGSGNAENNGPSGSSWTGSTWTVSGGSVSNAPTQGSELVTNAGLETWTSPTNLTNWTESISGTSTVNQETTTIHGGSNAVRLDVDASNSDVEIGQPIIFALGSWVSVSWWARASVADKTLISYVRSSGPARNPGTAWTNYVDVYRPDIANATYWLLRSSAASSSLYLDDVSVKVLNLSTLFRSVDAGSANVLAETAITRTAGTQSGLVLNLDSTSSPSNFIIVYENGNGNIKVDEAVAGVYTNKASTAVTYSAGAVLRAVRYGTSLDVYYNNAKVGSTLTMTANTNTKHGLFSTYSGNTFDNFVVWNRSGYTDAPFEELTSAAHDTGTKYAGTASAKLVAGGTDANFTQSINAGDTNTYNLSAYAYTDGSAITSSDLSLLVNGSTISTTYTSIGSGWYQLTGTTAGTASSIAYGVRVKSGKTVYVDNMSLNNYASSGTVTSSIFDAGWNANWGTLTYTATTPSNTSVSVKARTSSSSNMTGATAFASCTAISSGADISSNSCVTDGHRYIQYLLNLANTSTTVTPTFVDMTIAFANAVAPTGSISINSGSAYTNSRSVTLTLSASDDVDASSGLEMEVSENSDFSGASYESFSASKSFTLSTGDGTKTVYARFRDTASNVSSSYSDTIVLDTTNPVSFDLDSPGDNSYSNSERPNFKWKVTTDATAGLSKYVLEIDNPSIGSGQPSGDFTIDSIPTSRTTDYETNKYNIHYENFSDSDSTNNYISVYTKSHSDWGTSENDGKLREGKVSWKVKAADNAGNETSSSRTLLVDRSNPKVELTQINDIPFSSTAFNTTDKTPTIFGKITDSLSGGDSTQTQDENGPKIAAGPKQVDIKVEKKEGLLYKLITLYTINMDKPWYTCDNKEVSDNAKQKCDKYLPFEYISKENLELGTYKITLTGKDKADNASETSFTLNITPFAQITTPEEKEAVEEKIKELPKEEQEKVKEELEITKPVEPSALEKAGDQIFQTSKNILTSILTGIGQGVKFTVDTTGKALAFVSKTTSNALAALYNSTSSILASLGQKTGEGILTVAKGTGNLLASIGWGIGNTGKTIGNGYNNIANNAPGVAKTILTGIGQGVSVTTSTIGSVAHVVATTTTTIAQNTRNAIASATTTIVNSTTTLANNTGAAIANATQIGVSNTKASIANIAFVIGERTEDISHGVGTAIIEIGYLFVPEPTKISNVTAVALSSTSVKITWTTNHPANGKVNWGYEDGIYKFEDQKDKRTAQHEFILTNLKPDTEYHYEVMSQNRNYVYDANRKFKTPAK